MTLAVFCLARPTFDVRLAKASAVEAVTGITALAGPVLGGPDLLMDADMLGAAITAAQNAKADRVLVMQASFCDAGMVCEIAETLDLPLAIWAFPEPRDGGRLRLNSFCGLNLALHALGKRGIRAGWHHAAASVPPDLETVFQPGAAPLLRQPGDPAPDGAARALRDLRGPVGLFGTHPDGFDTCAFEPDDIKARFGAWVQPYTLDTLFDRARAVDPDRVFTLRQETERRLAGVDVLDPEPLEKSLRVGEALAEFAAEDGLTGAAVRCWPETFTDYGCAVCGGMARLASAHVPASCEADMLGTITSRLMQALAGQPVMLTDIVDIDPSDQTAVLWHCGLAPLEFCDPDFAAEATLHTNRMKPLLHQFPLKPGRVTIARISQANGEPTMVVGRGEMLRRPMAFTGTSGVIRFDCGAARARDTLLNGALEHHLSVTYGDIRDGLISAAKATGLKLLDMDRVDSAPKDQT